MADDYEEDFDDGADAVPSYMRSPSEIVNIPHHSTAEAARSPTKTRFADEDGDVPFTQITGAAANGDTRTGTRVMAAPVPAARPARNSITGAAAKGATASGRSALAKAGTHSLHTLTLAPSAASKPKRAPVTAGASSAGSSVPSSSGGTRERASPATISRRPPIPTAGPTSASHVSTTPSKGSVQASATHHASPDGGGSHAAASAATTALEVGDRQATMALREHYGAMIAARDKSIKGLQRRCEAFKAEVDGLRSQLSTGFQSDKLIELENAK